MLDDDRDKKLMRSQMVGIVLLTLLVALWFNFFVQSPSGPPRQPEQEEADLPKPSRAPTETEPAERIAVVEEGAWAALPPIPDEQLPAQDHITLENDDLRLVFTRIGARLRSASAKLHMHGEDEQQLVPESTGQSDIEAEYPFGLTFSDEELADALDRRRFDVLEVSDSSVSFGLTIPGAATVRKTFSLGETPYTLRLCVDYENLSDRPRRLGVDDTPAYTVGWAPNVRSGDQGHRMIRQLLIWRASGKYGFLETAKLAASDEESAGTKIVRAPEWIGVKSAYFLVAMKPVEFEAPRAKALGNKEQFRWSLAVPSAQVGSEETLRNAFVAYLGPSKLEYLAAAWPTLPIAFRFYQSEKWAWMDWFSKLLLRILNASYAVIPSYGIAIILLTILVRGVMYPLTLKSTRSMKKMQLLQPEMEELRKKHQDNPQEMNKKLMELYKERGVNPLGGCLPLFLQMPVFFALFRMLATTFELRHAPFLWIDDLSQADRLFHLAFLHGVPLLGVFEYLNILPLLMGGAMILQQKLMPTSGPTQNPQQKLMMTFMPVFFCFICYNMAAGLNLYILTSTALGILQQKLTRPGTVTAKPKKTSRRPKHFYDAVRARQRAIKKDIRRRKHQTRSDSAGAKPKRRKKT